MIEGKPTNPLRKAKAKQFYERFQIASELKAARGVEQGDVKRRYNINRSGEEYEVFAGGLSHFFNYIRGLPSNVVIDIGAGTGRAVKDLSATAMAQGIDFHVSTLSHNSKLQNNIPKEKIHITSAESLRGVKPNSVGGIISVIALEYSAIPSVAINKINESLVPGGVVKIVFLGPLHAEELEGSTPSHKDFNVFVRELRKLGYDVAEYGDLISSTFSENKITNLVVILAVKPGNPAASSAKELMRLDLEERDKKVVSERKGAKVFDVKFSRPRDNMER